MVAQRALNSLAMVRFHLGVPAFSGYSIMDNTAVFYTANVGSIPASRASLLPARLGSQRGFISLLAPD